MNDKSGDWVCNACGFRVPAGDHVGQAIMQAHLDEHDRESDDLDDEWCQGCNHAIDHPCEVHG